MEERLISLKVYLKYGFLLLAAMYQSEIMPDVDKVNKTMSAACDGVTSPERNQSTPRGRSQSGSKQANQSVECVFSATHDELTKHPSEVLIDFKVSKILLPEMSTQIFGWFMHSG